MQKTWFIILLFSGVLTFAFFSCQKKGDFIDEDELGTGIHYYPSILNDAYYDTVTRKFFNDTTFSPGQRISFQLKYDSQDSLSRIELWAAETGKKAQKIWDTAYSPAFYSPYQQCDTTYISVKLPVPADTTIASLTLYPKVVTQKGLETQSSVGLKLAP